MKKVITRKELIDLLIYEWDKTAIHPVVMFFMNMDDMKFIEECKKQHINLQLLRKNTYYMI